MDRFPLPSEAKGPNPEEVARRKKRLLERLRSLTIAKEEPRLVDLSEHAEQDEPVGGELWSRTKEAGAEQDPLVERVQGLGRAVLEQSHEVHQLTGSLVEAVDRLPSGAKQFVEHEAVELKEAAADLTDATEELDQELQGLEKQQSATKDEAGAEAPPAAAESNRAAPERRDRSEIMGMAQLVLATLIGGGLGAVVGEGLKTSKEKKAAKERTKLVKKIDEQEAKIAVQEAELSQLKAEKPAANAEPQKEYIKRAAGLAEVQADIAHIATEQVKAVVEMTTESDRTFKIPEAQPAEAVKTPETSDKLEGAERLRERSSEQQDAQGDEPAYARQIDEFSQDKSPVSGLRQKSSGTKFAMPAFDKAFTSKAWLYGILLAIAGLLALGLLLFR